MYKVCPAKQMVLAGAALCDVSETQPIKHIKYRTDTAQSVQ